MVCISFGLMNAPPCFQWFTEHCMDVYQYQVSVTCLDDLLIYSTTFEPNLEYLRLVLQRLKSHGFQWFTEHCMDVYQYQVSVTCLDDLLIYSTTFEPNLEYLRLVLQRLKSHGIRVKALNAIY